jgi:hypothetical protein
VFVWLVLKFASPQKKAITLLIAAIVHRRMGRWRSFRPVLYKEGQLLPNRNLSPCSFRIL